MLSIARVNKQLKHLFEHDAPELANQLGMRERTISFTQLALVLVLGWWSQPQSGPSALARFAGSVGLTVNKQTVDCHWTPRTADWLLALLRRAVQQVVQGPGVTLAWMRPFTAVWVEDGSTISLPAALAKIWRGCGGSAVSADKPDKSKAALKITVRWNLKDGELHGPHLQAGRHHELRSVLSSQQMPKGSLWLADLGYWSLMYLSTLIHQGVYFCMRVKLGAVIWHEKQRTDVVHLLASLAPEATQAEWVVNVGAAQLVKQVRLLVKRVPEEVAQQRQERIREYACKHSKPVNPVALELAYWTIILTNVPAGMMSLEQAFVVMKVRWQIELLFKLWKQEALLDEWSSHKPWRILCEVYAKLLAMVIQHWVMLLACDDDPHASWTGVAEIVREQVPTLVHGFRQQFSLGKALRLVIESVRGGCTIVARSTRLNTSRFVQSAFDPPVT